MNLKKTFILVAFMAAILMVVGFQSSSEHKVLFEKAKFTMETKGDLRGAIKLFNEIIEKYPDEREYAAKSQLYIGLCYEKLGLKEAQKAYQKVIDSYPEQIEAVKVAKEKLSILLRAQAVVEKGDKEFKIRQVWAGPDVDIFGAPSPDGRYLSYVDWDTGDLAIRELATGKKRRLTNKGSWFESSEFAEFSRWSPDGKQLVYQWYNKDDFYELHIIGLDGSEPRVLYSQEETEYIGLNDWAPDGKNILGTLSREDGSNQIILVSVADGSVSLLKTLDWGSTLTMSFSPDGRYIVYDFPPKEGTLERDIFLLSTDGKREMPLIEHPADDFVLGWAPDGKSILFASYRTGTLDAWVIQVADGKPQGPPELIKKGIGQIWPIGFTKKGSFYYGLGTAMVDIYIATLDLEKGKILSPPTKATQRFIGSNFLADWSPDGKYLAYISMRGPEPERPYSRVLCIRSMETGKEREILPKLRGFSYPRWSPDGRSILVFGSDKNRRQGLYLIDAQTGDITFIVQNEPGAVIKDYEWSPDGKAIFYTETNRTKKAYRILLYDLETRKEKELYQTTFPTAASNFYLALSPDGQQLAFATTDQSLTSFFERLKVMPAAGGEPRELLRLQPPERFNSIAWTADGREILFVKGSPSVQEHTFELWRVSAEGGEPQKLELAMDNLQVRVHPDGRRIAFSAGKWIREIWVMENFLPEGKAQKKSKSQQ